MAVQFADVVFDLEGRTLARAGELLHLSPKAFDLLAMLIAESPRVVRKSAIVDALWPEVIVEEANVRNLVAEIRSALGEAAGSGIVTLPRIGYAFRTAPAAAATGLLAFAQHEYPLFDGVTVVGRAADCGVTVAASGVSRYHFRITIRGREASVEDLNSKNGTRVNGRPLTSPVTLRGGDEIVAGRAVMQFRFASAEDETTTLKGCEANQSCPR